MIRPFLFFLFAFSPLLIAQEPKPVITKVSENELRIGKVTLNQKSREVRFGAGLNMNEGLIEYILVLTSGKVHESLFLTDITPSNLNIALKLLNFQESPELFAIVDENYIPTNKFPEVPEKQKKAARLSIDVEWEVNGKTKRTSLNKLIYHIVREKSMMPGPWLNTGSYIHEGRFKADVGGDIIAIFTAQPAMINYPGKDRDNDDVWIPNKKLLPELESEVTLIIWPHTETTQHKKP